MKHFNILWLETVCLKASFVVSRLPLYELFVTLSLSVDQLCSEWRLQAYLCSCGVRYLSCYVCPVNVCVFTPPTVCPSSLLCVSLCVLSCPVVESDSITDLMVGMKWKTLWTCQLQNLSSGDNGSLSCHMPDLLSCIRLLPCPSLSGWPVGWPCQILVSCFHTCLALPS